MVSGMVEQFREMQHLLAEAIERYETAEFRALDGNIARVFDAIYRHEPRDAEEARIIMGLLLDIIENNDTGDNIHLIRRVRAIIEAGAGRRPPDMEIANGAGI